MSQEDDEFKNVKKGLPSEATAQKAGIKFIALFSIAGIIVAMVVLEFGEKISSMLDDNEYMLAQVLMTGLLALLVGSLQAWIFKAKIKSHLQFFVGFSFLGGIIGGLAGGLLMDLGIRGTGSSLIIGAINGFLAGTISSVAQNKLMGNKKYGARWFLFNTISWTVIFSIAWKIGWLPENTVNVAIAGAFLMIASGISLVVFLRGTPQIEFS
jgi:Co/Zn/Cd efflux system component